MRDWESLETLLPELRKHKLYREEEQTLLEQNVYMALLSSAGKQAEKTPASADKILSDAWHNVPKHIRAQDAVIALYGKLLIEMRLSETAEKLLRKRLSDHWHQELVLLYGLASGPQPREQLATAEKWLRDRPGDADLLLTLGRISLRNQLWGKARDYFESSLRFKPQPETYAELGRLFAYLGEHERSTELYQQGLLATTHGLPTLPMPEGNRLGKGEWRAEDDEQLELPDKVQ